MNVFFFVSFVSFVSFLLCFIALPLLHPGNTMLGHAEEELQRISGDKSRRIAVRSNREGTQRWREVEGDGERQEGG